MVVLSQPFLDALAQIKTCKINPNLFTEIPVVDLSDPNAKTVLVEACKEFGFFKVINHRISMDLLTRLESESVKFFGLTQQEKEKCGPSNPYGYGNKKIGVNGDMGWVEYLLFCTNPELISHNATAVIPGISEAFLDLVKEYVCAVKKMTCEVLEMMAEELQIGEKDVWSRMIRDERSDSRFRLNHYPPWPCRELQELSGRNLIGFGEHTDPQIISVLRSNNVSGLQICLKDCAWVSVPPDHTSFFFNVGDSLQVMTNGRFRSVKHRVVADGLKSRVSMIYFGGPALSQKMVPLDSVMEDGEESLYDEFTWSDYTKAAYKTKLGDNRLALFEKSATRLTQ